jgi:Tol biopolymer transport system component
MSGRTFTLLIAILSISLLGACGTIGGYRGQLAFESERDGNSEVYLVDANGRNLINLTNNESYDGTPAFSPDGGAIAFTSDRTGNPEIFIMKPDGSDPSAITEGKGFNVVPTFSPDGKDIVFSSNRTYRIPAEEGEIEIPDTTKLWTIILEDGSVRRLTSDLGLDMYASYSPDGKEIAFMTVREGNPEIYVLTVDGREVNLTNNPTLDMVPDWSPDGTKILFMSDREEGNKEIYVYDLEGDSVENLTKHPANDSDPAWSPDGSMIAFVSDRDGNVEIYVMRADGTGVRRVTDNPADDIHPVWNPVP